MIREGLDKQKSKELSIHPELNSFFDVPGMNPFFNPPCRMHSTDHGIFVKLLDLVKEVVKKERKSAEFDKRFFLVVFGQFNFNFRFASLRPFGKMRLFHKGVSELSFVRAHEHRSMTAVLPFVLQGLLSSDTAKQTSLVYLQWRDMLSMRIYTADSTKLLDATGKKLQFLLNQLSLEVEGKKIGGNFSL